MLHYLTGSEHKIVHAYKVSGWGCRTSRVRQTRSHMPTRYYDRVAGSQGFERPDSTCLERIRTGLQWLQDLRGKEHQIVHAYEVSGWGCMISRVRNNSSNMHTRYQDGAARSHGFERPDSTCLERIRTGLKGLQDLRGKEHQIVHAYEVSGWGCMISRVRNNSSNMHTRYQDGAAGSHGFDKPDRTCLRGIRTRLQDLTGLEHHIVHA